jgi:hypothetical protein
MAAKSGIERQFVFRVFRLDQLYPPINDGSHNLHAQFLEVDVGLFNGQNFLHAKARALS